MKKIILSLIAVMACMSISAQVIKVYDTKTSTTEPVKTYTNTDTEKYKVVFEEVPAAPSNKFTVAEGKHVQFTKGNLYWDGSAYHFEANQTDYQTSWNTSHVDHFYWSKDASVMYAEEYSDASAATSDAFFFCEANKNNEANKVDGESGYYALTSTEWDYLINTRTNASSLCKYGVTVTNGETSYSNCVIIAPDDYDYTTTPLSTNYTLDEVNAAGLVCLPAAGLRDGDSVLIFGNYGYYWTATFYGIVRDDETERYDEEEWYDEEEHYLSKAFNLWFYWNGVFPDGDGNCSTGYSLRLVRGL